MALAGDITGADKITQAVQQTIDTFGKIDIVVNNVGAGPKTSKEPGPGPLGRTEAHWDALYEQNLRAPVLMCEAVAPHFIEQKSGKIVNISSIAGRVALPEKLQQRIVPQSYSAMKTGLISYTQTLAERLGPYNINVNCVCPGTTATSRTDFYGRGEAWEQRAAGTALGRNGTDEEVGGFIAYLCTEAASWITGQAINFNGGALMEH